MIKKIISLCLVFIISFSFISCSKQEEKKQQADFSQVTAIAELATLKTFYHNTSELKDDGLKLFKFIANIGYKKVWIEYDGIVNWGIDASKVRVEPSENKVKVFVPNATILSVDVDVDSMTETQETGWFARITAEEKAGAQEKAQNDMKEKVEKNENMRNQAKTRAENLIKNSIINIGQQIGVVYEIEFLSE